MMNNNLECKKELELSDYSIAILVPCYNEAATIATVIDDFRVVLPSAQIYVYDNNSIDDTFKIANGKGVIVKHERYQGKGNVVKRMFSDINADIYIMVDGDATYDASSAPGMVELLINKNLDLVNGVRVSSEVEAYRSGHRFGNYMLTTLVAKLFGKQTNDMLTGYRVFTYQFVKSFPIKSAGFEIETELTVHASDLKLKIEDFETQYGARPEGSYSKLSTYKDGLKILFMIIRLLKHERPSILFYTAAIILLILSALLIYPIYIEYLHTGLVPRFPSAILAGFIMTLAILSAMSGLILASITEGRHEAKLLSFLSKSRYFNQFE